MAEESLTTPKQGVSITRPLSWLSHLRYLLKARDGTPIEQEVLGTIHMIP